MATAALTAGVCVAAAVAVSLSHRETGVARLFTAPASATARRTAVRRQWLAAAGAGLGVAIVLGGGVGLVAGVVVTVILEQVLRRSEPLAVRRRREQIAADLPAALDLIAACLLAGAPPGVALDATARAIDGPLGATLGSVAVAVRCGLPAAEAWAAADGEPALAPLARAMTRAAASGSALADLVHTLADDARADAAAMAASAARRVGVLAVAPLGACFLPAFVLVAVVPVVVSLATGLAH